MPNPDHPTRSKNQKGNKRAIFVFLGAHNFWEGLYDTVNIGFIRCLIDFKIIHDVDILMTTIIPDGVSQKRLKELAGKEEQLQSFAQNHSCQMHYYHIQGRTIKGLLSASREISQFIQKYDRRFIWAQNYFNTLIGVLIKKRTQSNLHFDMRGLVPQEELHHSSANIISRITKFIVLKGVERINIKNADSISTVSKRFKEYIESKYRLKDQEIEILPNYFDPNQFFINENLREHYRQKLQVSKNQKIILYSGMLQKWQDPELLFSFLKNIQDQDIHQEYKFLVLTYDQVKASHFSNNFGIRDLIIESAPVDEINGLYNAADIGLAFRDANIASIVASPVKIPEYLATGNSLISLESIGDFGQELVDKPYTLIKKNRTEILNILLDEIRKIKQPSPSDLQEIYQSFSYINNREALQRIITNL